ncbi:MAG: hypothetical protein UW73_C0011G0023 [Microgenomates group bacterium GW2011_GWB1_44_8]|nr:MAG: hypothetical protein UW73_C0011G0023 [Microgenomates group bacterium GW2011_GWB1_44_8]
MEKSLDSLVRYLFYDTIPTMDTAALQLGARFALGPNQLGYCGRGTAPEKFKRCLTTGNCAGVKEEFSKFIVFYPYLRTLSYLTKLDRYSYPVMEAYWLGNDQLKKANTDHYEILISYFSRQGVPGWLINELKNKKPKVFIPFHLFQTLHVGVGRASSAVPFNLESINNCMVKWGTLLKVNGKQKQVSVRLNMLEKSQDAKYKLIQSDQVVSFSPALIGELKKGDMVAVHWKMVAKKLKSNEVANLSLWTRKVLETVEPSL